MSRLSRRRAYIEMMAPDLDGAPERVDGASSRSQAFQRRLGLNAEDAAKMAPSSAASNDLNPTRTSDSAVRRTSPSPHA
jgi:hypothetical protein